MKNLFLTFLFLSFYSVKGQNLNKSNSTNKCVKVREFIVPPLDVVNVSGMKEDTTFNETLVLLEISNLLDSIREYIYDCDLLDTEIDFVASKGCEHHNNYLKNLINPKNLSDAYVTHNEVLSFSDGVKYVGKDTLIDDWSKRHYYYSKKDTLNYMFAIGEVCMVGPLLNIIRPGFTPKDIAKQIIFNFYSSKEHWEILTDKFYNQISADIQFRKNSNGEYSFWFTLVTGVRYIKKVTTHKSKFYYPGNKGGLTEYYQVVKTEKIGNW